MKGIKVFRVFMLVVIISSGSMIFISDERLLWFIIFMWQTLTYLYSKKADDYKEITDLQNQLLKEQEELIDRLKKDFKRRINH